MKKWKKTILVLIIFGLIVLFVFKKLNSLDTLENPKYPSVEKAIDSLQKQNTAIDTVIVFIYKTVDSLNHSLEKDKQALKVLKHKKNENLSRIHNATNVQLFEFFTKFKTEDSIH